MRAMHFNPIEPRDLDVHGGVAKTFRQLVNLCLPHDHRRLTVSDGW